MNEAGEKPTVFISYSHKDEKLKDRLVTQLGVLRAQGLINIWEDRQIEAGADWNKNIQEAMKVSSIAVILISANSLTSDYLLNEEVPPLIERSAKEGVRIFPLVVEPCAWQSVKWLRAMNLRPTDGRPLSDGNENQIDKDLAALTSEIYLLIQSATRSSSGQTFVALAPDAVSISRLPVTGRELFGRELELDMLDGAWADSKTNVLSLIAWGGVGKSALVNYWLRSIARDNYRGAEKVYAWSFYRQGTSEQGVSADQFIDAALRWFGDADPAEGSPWERGERLARLIKQQRTLLLLDGLEPLQYPPGRGLHEGALKDQSMQALLRELAALNPGLCVISSRLPVADLADYEGDTARRINLEDLSPQAGAEILKAQKVVGTQDELEQAASEFGNHALAVTLLGSYLKNVHKGDISQRNKVDILKEDEERGGHAQRVMASYEKWFGEGPELAILRMLGLFDRPADGQAIAALRAEPVIPGLTDTLQNLSDEDWQRTLGRLRSANLIAGEDLKQPDTLDAHPLVREYFKQQLKRDCPDAWREGNKRLYEHLKSTAQDLPKTVKEMSLLYAAVAHGCQAGLYKDAFINVYYKRIQRGREFYSLKKLGTVGDDLVALSHFFDPPWTHPVAGLTGRWRTLLLGQAGFRLRAIGKLGEAFDLMNAALEADQARAEKEGLETNHVREAWMNASIDVSTLGTLRMIQGKLSEALAHSQQGCEFADLSHDNQQRVSARRTLGDVLHNMGRLSEAEHEFCHAEEIQNKGKEPSSSVPVLSYRHRDLLLTQGRYSEVQSMVERILESQKSEDSDLVDVALNFLSIGQAHMFQAREGKVEHLAQAETYLKQAVAGLREARRQDHLPRGLLALAEYHLIAREADQAQAHLEKALDIATRCGMGLYQAGCHLLQARLYLAQGEKEQAQESWAQATEMIEQMGYHQRDKEVEEIRRELEEMPDE